MSILRNTSLVITDWSGVISDDRRIVYEANMRLLTKYGKPRRPFEEWLVASMATCVEYLVSCGIDINPDIATGEYTYLLRELKSEGMHPVAYSDANTFFQGLNGRDIVVVSSHPEAHLRSEAQEYGLANHITRFVGDATNKAVEIIRALGDTHTRSRVIYLGDTVFDVRAAKRAGVLSVGVATGYHSRDRLVAEEPDVVVDSLVDLLTYL